MCAIAERTSAVQRRARWRSSLVMIVPFPARVDGVD